MDLPAPTAPVPLTGAGPGRGRSYELTSPGTGPLHVYAQSSLSHPTVQNQAHRSCKYHNHNQLRLTLARRQFADRTLARRWSHDGTGDSEGP